MSKANGLPSEQSERSSIIRRSFASLFPVPKGRSSIFLLVVSFLLLSLSVFYAPSFLLISEAPVKADVVVVFPGGEKGAREKEAHQLIREGFADYLIIPAYGQIMKRAPDGTLVRIDTDLKLNTASSKPRLQDELLNTSNFNLKTDFKTASRLENTHIEILEAKRLMDEFGFRAALLVSSPYHMRRIKVITGKVFNDSQAVRYIPTRYESPREGFWLFNSSEGKLILSEYAKIVWFLLYSALHV